MNETIFRVLAALLLFTSVGISSYFRRKADRMAGEKLSRRADGGVMMMVIGIGGLILWLSPLVYLINPQWMAWAKAGLPAGLRWLGVAGGAVCTLLLYWLFRSIGTNISPTSATRTQHRLVTHGPYRWVRHPLYSVGSTLFVSFGMMADNWFIAMLGLLAFLVMALRTPQEEARLIEKFGDEYRQYMKKTGRFLPKLPG